MDIEIWEGTVFSSLLFLYEHRENYKNKIYKADRH